MFLPIWECVLSINVVLAQGVYVVLGFRAIRDEIVASPWRIGYHSRGLSMMVEEAEICRLPVCDRTTPR